MNPYPGFANSDKPMYNEGQEYKVFLTVSTTGCTSDTYWSYYEVCVGCAYQKMSMNLLETGELYHYVDRESATLHLVNENFNEATLLNFEVYSIDGRQQLNTSNFEIDLNSLNRGTYLIVAKSGSDVVYREKFVW
jgi:hypothetical protein